MTEREHALHIYRDDATLATTVAAFLSPAFAEGQAIVAIGTRAHVSAIEQRLRTDGHDVESAWRAGRYVSMDAEAVVPRLLRDGLPTRESFDQLVGREIVRLATAHGGVRAFGEIVSVLWRDGKRSAAIRLEDLWNEALGYHPLSLLCGYREKVLHGHRIDAVIGAHTTLIDGPSSGLKHRGTAHRAAG